MTDTPPPLSPDWFEALYRRDPDPWRFASSEYERDKYAETLAALPPRRFVRGFEIGCSIGVLTRQLAARCDALLAVDVAETALVQARERCAGLPGVELRRMRVPGEWPDGQYDIVLFSEVLYYLAIDEIRVAAERTLASLLPDGAVLLVHWHGPTDGTCPGDEAAERFIAACAPRLTPVLQRRAEKYRMDLLVAPDGIAPDGNVPGRGPPA